MELVDAVIFVADLNCRRVPKHHDLHDEITSKSPLEESMDIFNTVANSPWLILKPLILLLSNVELFRAQVQESLLEDIWPEYKDGLNTEKATDFVTSHFRSLVLPRAKRSMYSHVVGADDHSLMRHIISDMNDIFIEITLVTFLSSNCLANVA